MALLHGIFGPGVYKLKVDVRQFVTPTNRKLELNVVSSQYHLELTPSDMGNNDRIVIQQLIKEVAQMEQVDFSDSKDGLAHRYKCVVINEADSLTRDAQAALRRTMEKYSRNIRLIMICDSMSSIIAPIKSRCLLLRSSSPTNDEMVQVLSNVVESENVSLDSGAILNKIVQESNGNLRTALLMLETMSLNNEMRLNANTTIIKPDWVVVIGKLAHRIRTERNVKCLIECRAIIYDLLSHCIPARLILQELTMFLLHDASITDKKKGDIIEHSSLFDERLALGNKVIFHLEGYVARVMCTLDQ